ncbi:hypothetical protein FGO68_gene8281 [Halteria grandinella]|uniref:Uncharacterized protein n=1 Tax=Halteria grandinella TaxID=5974 RepID=A0A8J8T1M5_HALGN|nr:hypothetical protein FGO68_gene8281 [Halteria grandinella]
MCSPLVHFNIQETAFMVLDYLYNEEFRCIQCSTVPKEAKKCKDCESITCYQCIGELDVTNTCSCSGKLRDLTAREDHLLRYLWQLTANTLPFKASLRSTSSLFNDQLQNHLESSRRSKSSTLCMVCLKPYFSTPSHPASHKHCLHYLKSSIDYFCPHCQANTGQSMLCHIQSCPHNLEYECCQNCEIVCIKRHETVGECIGDLKELRRQERGGRERVESVVSSKSSQRQSEEDRPIESQRSGKSRGRYDLREYFNDGENIEEEKDHCKSQRPVCLTNFESNDPPPQKASLGVEPAKQQMKLLKAKYSIFSSESDSSQEQEQRLDVSLALDSQQSSEFAGHNSSADLYFSKLIITTEQDKRLQTALSQRKQIQTIIQKKMLQSMPVIPIASSSGRQDESRDEKQEEDSDY